MAVLPIQTERFILTKMTAADGDKYYRLSNNARVMKYVTGFSLTREESDKMLRDFLSEYGQDTYLGRYLIEEKHSGELIGAAKLDKVGFEIEIGYRIMEEHWGKGFATEIAGGLIAFAIHTLKAATVIAFVNIKNAPSIRVLEKVGMKRLKLIEDIDEVKYKYSYSTQNYSPMKKAIYILLGIVAVFLIAALVMPKEYAVERDIVINKPSEQVFNYVKSLRNQDKWSVWMRKDPNIVKEYTGRDGEKGFISIWKGNEEVGKGEQEIIRVEEGKRIDTELRFKEPFESTSQAYMITEPVNATSTRVRWGFTGEMPVPMNVIMPFMNIEKTIGKDFQDGLINLKAILDN